MQRIYIRPQTTSAPMVGTRAAGRMIRLHQIEKCDLILEGMRAAGYDVEYSSKSWTYEDRMYLLENYAKSYGVEY